MSKWAVVEDGNITEYYDSIPDSWRNVSNMFALENDQETLALFGWYSVNNVTKPLSNNQVYGPVSYTFNPTTNTVIQDCLVIDVEPPSPAIEFNIRRSKFFEYLRNRRNQLLTQSDWTQLQDIVGLKSVAWQNDWKDYRQTLRDFPEIYVSSYPNEIVIENIKWPKVPES